MLAGVGLDLRAVEGDPAELHETGRLAQPEDL